MSALEVIGKNNTLAMFEKYNMPKYSVWCDKRLVFANSTEDDISSALNGFEEMINSMNDQSTTLYTVKFHRNNDVNENKPITDKSPYAGSMLFRLNPQGGSIKPIGNAPANISDSDRKDFNSFLLMQLQYKEAEISDLKERLADAYEELNSQENKEPGIIGFIKDKENEGIIMEGLKLIKGILNGAFSGQTNNNVMPSNVHGIGGLQPTDQVTEDLNEAVNKITYDENPKMLIAKANLLGKTLLELYDSDPNLLSDLDKLNDIAKRDKDDFNHLLNKLRKF